MNAPLVLVRNHVWRAAKTAATDDVAARPRLLNDVVVETSDQVPRERAARSGSSRSTRTPLARNWSA